MTTTSNSPMRPIFISGPPMRTRRRTPALSLDVSQRQTPPPRRGSELFRNRQTWLAQIWAAVMSPSSRLAALRRILGSSLGPFDACRARWREFSD